MRMIWGILLIPSSVIANVPIQITATTLADPKALADLQRPGVTVFTDGFESERSWASYFEIGGKDEGRAVIDMAKGIARSGKGALRVTATANGGASSGAGPCLWLGPDGYDRLHFRRWIKFTADYDQGNLHHVGGWLEATAGSSKWDDMGTAGQRPNGSDWFNASFEPWCDWRRTPPPGFMFLYVYWQHMQRDRDGNWWGNNLTPEPESRTALERDRWYCLEHMIKANTPGKTNGELASWIDGKLYQHYTGIRWRNTEKVKLKRVCYGVYVHQSMKPNTVWYDDIAISTGYIGR